MALAPTPWQPLSARPKLRDPMPARLRAALLAAVVALHLLALAGLMALLERRQRAQDDAIVVDFIDLPPPPPEATVVPNETITIRMPQPAPEPEPARPKPQVVPIDARPAPVDLPMQAVEPPRDQEPRLYNPDGSLRTPGDMLDRIDEEYGDKREFSWQIPHMDDAKKYFERNPALVHEETRFDQYWTPDHDALTALLEKAVEKTTREVKVKVPGMNGSSHLVCTVAVLALSGTCRVITNGADWNGPQDDPNTLNPEEDRQCQAWWDKIIGANTQDAWRETKKLYEESCRKPLLRPPSG